MKLNLTVNDEKPRKSETKCLLFTCYMTCTYLCTISAFVCWAYTSVSIISITSTVSLNPAHGEVYSIHHNDYVIEFFSDLRRVGGLNWPPRYNWNIVESGIKHHNPSPIISIAYPICRRGDALGSSVDRSLDKIVTNTHLRCNSLVSN